MAEEKKLSKKIDELVENVSKLSVLELSELVSALQEKLGVSATPQVTVAAPAASSEAVAETPQSGAIPRENCVLHGGNSSSRFVGASSSDG